VRTFLACQISRQTRNGIARAARSLSRFNDAVRWVRTEQLHLTIKFLGDVRDADVPALCDALTAATHNTAPFDLTLTRLGCFPPKGPVRVIWAGHNDTPETLVRLVHSVETQLEPLGFARERRPFTTHITLGRVKTDTTGDRLRSVVGKTSLQPTKDSIDMLTLFESHLSPKGPTHIPLATFPLNVTGKPSESRATNHAP